MSVDEALLRDYCALKKQESEIKVAVNAAKGKVLANLQAASADEVNVPEFGKLVVVPKRTYKYPDSVVKMQEDLKKAETDAIARGDATYTESAFVRFDQLEVTE